MYEVLSKRYEVPPLSRHARLWRDKEGGVPGGVEIRGSWEGRSLGFFLLAQAFSIMRSHLTLGKLGHKKPLRSGSGVERWWRDPDSNRGHAHFQCAALPTELSRRKGRGEECLGVRASIGICRLTAGWDRNFGVFIGHLC
jgi:hypothetical protein